MDTKKYNNNLQKSSGLFLQLGLVLTLFTVYLALELKTEKTTTILSSYISDIEDPYEFVALKEFQIEKKVVKRKTTPILKKPTPQIFTVTKVLVKPNDAPPFEPIDPEKGNPTEPDLSGLVDVNIGDPLDNDTHLINNIQEVPIYPGCEKKEKQSERRACFKEKVRKFVGNKFNGNLATELGLASGKKRIVIEFIITKTGEIEITNASAPHISLEKEGKRIVKKLPKMIPGKQNGKTVKVKYVLPISFNVIY